MELEAERARRQREHKLQLSEMQAEISHLRSLQKDKYDEDERRKVLQQHRRDLENLRANPIKTPLESRKYDQDPSQEPVTQAVTAKKREVVSISSKQSREADSQNQKADGDWSSASNDWEYQKKYEGARSDEIDSLMSMIGLEDVKQNILGIKAKVDTATRQNIDLKDERFGTVLIGNPGTGKTSLARLTHSTAYVAFFLRKNYRRASVCKILVRGRCHSRRFVC